MIDDELDDPMTVMLLRQSEWNHLADICKLFLAVIDKNPQLVNATDRSDIAKRIIDACE